MIGNLALFVGAHRERAVRTRFFFAFEKRTDAQAGQQRMHNRVTDLNREAQRAAGAGETQDYGQNEHKPKRFALSPSIKTWTR